MTRAPATYVEVLALWPGVTDLARDLGLSYDTVSAWLNQDAIPVAHWAAVVRSAEQRRIAGVDLPLLYSLHRSDAPAAAQPPAAGSLRHTGIYPGTFDPVTNGHMDIISRAARILDRLVVGVAANASKGPIFPLKERIELVRAEIEAVAGRTGTIIEVVSFSGLLIDFARSNGARVIIRGLRAVSDFDYEFQMAGMNYRLDPAIETVFLTASETHQFISSRFVKEIARLGGDISTFVPPLTLQRTLARVRAAG